MHGTFSRRITAVRLASSTSCGGSTPFQLGGEDASLPGDIQFALHYRAAGHDYWDNNSGQNYAINADSGVRMGDGFPLLNIDFQSALRPGQEFLPDYRGGPPRPAPKKVFVHWTTDHWRQTQTSECFFRRRHWDGRWEQRPQSLDRYDAGFGSAS